MGDLEEGISFLLRMWQRTGRGFPIIIRTIIIMMITVRTAWAGRVWSAEDAAAERKSDPCGSDTHLVFIQEANSTLQGHQ